MVNPDIEHGPAGASGSQDQPMHMKLLRAMVEGTSGEEIKNRILNEGEESIIRELSNEASELRQVLKEQDPEGWVKFVESQEAAMRNQRLAGMERNVSAIE
jgi:hypothetical protein